MVPEAILEKLEPMGGAFDSCIFRAISPLCLTPPL